MTLVEAVLTYRPHGVGGGGATPISIGKTSDPGILRTLRDRLLAQADEEAEVWRVVDPGVAAMQTAEAQRLAQILGFLLPDEELKPDLRLVEPGHDKGA
jgi:hypothetical protein